MSLRVTVLGCGNSTGVPMANGDWGACDPAEPRNRRRRSSILIEREGTTVLVDAGPDLRQQLLETGVTRLDAVIFTHAHADHTQGIDDLRVFGMKTGPLPIYAFPEVLDQLRMRFRYMFGGGGRLEGYYDKPFFDVREIEPNIRIGALDFTLFEQDHIVCRSCGVRTGPFAYSTDLKHLSDAAFDALSGIDVWLVAAIRREPHVAHANLDQVLKWIERARPERAILTHMNPTLDYRTLCAEMGDGIEPAYDGLVIEFDG